MFNKQTTSATTLKLLCLNTQLQSLADIQFTFPYTNTQLHTHTHTISYNYVCMHLTEISCICDKYFSCLKKHPLAIMMAHTLKTFSLMQTLSLSEIHSRNCDVLFLNFSPTPCLSMHNNSCTVCWLLHALSHTSSYVTLPWFPPSQVYYYNSCTLHHYIFKMYNHIT